MPTTVQDASLLTYRPWEGSRRSSMAAVCAIARISCVLLLRQRIFWFLLALALLAFFFFFYAQYLMVWISQQLAGETIRFGAFTIQTANLVRFLDRLALNGSAHTFGNFIWFQGYILAILLAFGGIHLFGNDQNYGALSFYLTKPITAWHYLIGKVLCIMILVMTVTFIPAVILWLEAGLLFDWKTYYINNFHLLLGISGYCLLLTLTLGVLLAVVAMLLRQTAPLVLVWLGLFVLLRLMANWLTLVNLDPRWRLLDLWNDLYLCGMWCLGAEHTTIRPVPQPDYLSAGLVVISVILSCKMYIYTRIINMNDNVV